MVILLIHDIIIFLFVTSWTLLISLSESTSQSAVCNNATEKNVISPFLSVGNSFTEHTRPWRLRKNCSQFLLVDITADWTSRKYLASAQEEKQWLFHGAKVVRTLESLWTSSVCEENDSSLNKDAGILLFLHRGNRFNLSYPNCMFWDCACLKKTNSWLQVHPLINFLRFY